MGKFFEKVAISYKTYENALKNRTEDIVKYIQNDRYSTARSLIDKTKKQISSIESMSNDIGHVAGLSLKKEKNTKRIKELGGHVDNNSSIGSMSDLHEENMTNLQEALDDFDGAKVKYVFNRSSLRL